MKKKVQRAAAVRAMADQATATPVPEEGKRTLTSLDLVSQVPESASPPPQQAPFVPTGTATTVGLDPQLQQMLVQMCKVSKR